MENNQGGSGWTLMTVIKKIGLCYDLFQNSQQPISRKRRARFAPTVRKGKALTKGSIYNMSTYIEDIFTRVNLSQIREFLLRGVEPLETEDQTYGARLEKGREAIYKRLQTLYTDDEDSLDEAYYDLAQALGSHESVFIEIGMKAGARLVYQLLLTTEPEVKHI